MYVVREITTGLAVYLLASEPQINATGLHGEVRAIDIRPETHEVVEVEPPPGQWVPGAWALGDGQWVVSDQARYEAAAAAKALTDARETLASLDAVLPRALEDVIEATVPDESVLPGVMRDRLAAKRAARQTIRDLTA